MSVPKRIDGKGIYAPRVAVREDGRLWVCLGGGPIVEHIGHTFVQMFPAAQLEIDDVLDEVWVWEPAMAVEEYVHLGIRLHAEWFRRE